MWFLSNWLKIKIFFANREMSEVENVQENWSQFIDLFRCELNTL
jgi:hypothetical protein